jgi:hypothetical protein
MTKNKNDNDSAPTSERDAIRVLRSGNCPSLSGKSKLTYEFRLDDKAGWHVRIAKSSGTGYFSKDWIPMEHVQRVLAKNGAKPISCHTLGPIFKGRSVNTPGFVLAVLKHVGLVQTSPENPRNYQLLDGQAFFAELEEAARAATTGTKPLAPKKKAASKAPKA